MSIQVIFVLIGVVTRIAGGGSSGSVGISGYADGIGTAALFSAPSAVVLDTIGVLYVADTSNHCIRKINPLGTALDNYSLAP